MLQGLLAAIALIFAPVEASPREPTPLVILDTLASPQADHCKLYVSVSVSSTGALRVRSHNLDGPQLGPVTVTIQDMPRVLKSRLSSTPGCDRVYLEANDDVAYVEVLKIVSILHNNGFQRIALIGPWGH